MGKSSKDKRDIYYRLAKEQSWRARSAFKLLHLDEEFNLISDPSVTRVLDLCAAPGSWSQVLSRVLVKGECLGRRAWDRRMRLERRIVVGDIPELEEEVRVEEERERKEEGYVEDDGALRPREGVRIVAVDLQPISPLPGVRSLVADITRADTIPKILELLEPDTDDLSHQVADLEVGEGNVKENEKESGEEGKGKGKAKEEETVVDEQEKRRRPVDLVICDGAPDVTGLHDLDIYIQSQLLYSALNLTLRILKPGGKFVAKIFRGKDIDFIYAQMRCFFEKVSCAKPRSSRASSLEAFIVCEGFGIPEGVDVESLSLAVGEPVKLPNRSKQVSSGKEARFVDGQRRTVGKDGIIHIELEQKEDNSWIAPFLACGDLSSWDADATYPLPEGYKSLDPIAPPVNPPYKAALEERRRKGGFYGKTKK